MTEERTEMISDTEATQAVLKEMDSYNIRDIQRIGANVQQQLSRDVDAIAEKSMTIDCDEAGKTLAALTTATDIKSLVPRHALLPKVVNPIKQTTRRYRSIERNLVVLEENIHTAKENLDKNLNDIDVLLEASQKHFKSLTPYIDAIDLKIEALTALKSQKEQASDETENLEVLQIDRMIEAYKRRQKDLGVSKVVAYQTVKECMLLSGSNEALSERMQYAIDNLIPLYKQQLVAAVAVRIQKDSTKILNSMSNAVSDLMVDTAKNISSNMKAVKEMNENPILNINRLKEVETALNQLVDEMKNQNSVNGEKHTAFMKNVEQLTIDHEQWVESETASASKVDEV